MRIRIPKVVAAVVLSPALFFTMGAAPASASVLYDNGASNNVLGGPLINGGIATTDSFVLAGAANVTGVTLFVWEWSDAAFNGVPVTSVDWSITSSDFGGTTYASGTAAPTDLFVRFPSGPAGYDTLRSETVSIPTLGLSAGTYWLQIQNAASGDGDKLTWDLIGGASQAYIQSPTGGISSDPSEAFQVLGDTTGAPEPGSFGLLATGVLGVAALRRRLRSVR